MKLAARLRRAEYGWQPAQIFRRLWRVASLTPWRQHTVIRLPWQLEIAVNPREIIGSSIVALNMLDLPVTEAIWRLLDARAVCADVGANIGFMTSVMAARLTGGGTVHSFEPHPLIAERLAANVARWQPKLAAHIVLHRRAVSDSEDAALLHLPPGFAANQGIASLVPATASTPASTIAVDCVRLDVVLGSVPIIDLVKVDVEGHELAVFRGAERLLREGRIRDVVFEEHDPAGGRAGRCLREHGYEVFRIARRRSGPQLVPPTLLLPNELDPATYLATRDPARARLRFAAPGWLVFRDTRKQSSA